MIGRGTVPPTGELIAFEAAARHQSFTRAAAELNLTQTAVSKAIRGLEARIGCSLFERARQRVVLTAAGEDYLLSLAPLLHAIGEATRRARANKSGEQTLTLAVLPTLGIRWLIPRLPAFLAEHPGTIVNLCTRLRPFDLQSEGIDAAFHHGRQAWPKASLRHLMDEQMVPMASVAYAKSQQIDKPDDLTRATLLHQSTRPGAWTLWHKAAGLNADKADRGPSFDQFGMIVEAAAAGMGVALLPQFLAEPEMSDGKLKILFDFPLNYGSGYFLALPEHRPSMSAIQFSNWLETQLLDSGLIP